MGLKTSNIVTKLITASVAVADTTISVTDTTGLPDVSDPADYTIISLVRAIDGLYEIVRVDSFTTSELTVVRAQEGTTALAFSPQDQALNFLTSGMFEEIQTQAQTAGAYQYLGTSGAISSEASVEFTDSSWFDGTYKELIFKLIDLEPAVNGQELYLTASTDGGSTYISSGYQYASNGRNSSAANSTSDENSGSNILIHGENFSQGDDVGEELSGSISLYGTNSATYKKVLFDMAYKNGAGNLLLNNGAGSINTTSAVDAIKFAYNSDDIASGEILVYGVSV